MKKSVFKTVHELRTFRFYLLYYSPFRIEGAIISRLVQPEERKWSRRSSLRERKGRKEQTDRKCGMSLSLGKEKWSERTRDPERARWLEKGEIYGRERERARERERWRRGGKKVSRLCGDWRSLVPWTGGARLANVQPSPRSTQAVSNHARAATGRTRRRRLFFFFFFFSCSTTTARLKTDHLR